MKLLLLLLPTLLALAETPAAWKNPVPPFQITQGVYYVGTEDLGCYLVTTPQGHILINTGLADSAAQLKAGMEKLGFHMADVKILLTMQAHYDHVAAIAEIAKATGAKMFATPGDKAALESGGKVDGFNDPATEFAPVHVDRVLRDGETIRLGDARLTVLFHPGHTKGAASYQITNGGKPVLLVNVPSVVLPLVGNQSYPNIVKDFERTFASQKKLHPGIWLAGHASQSGMLDKMKTSAFDDPEGYTKAIAKAEAAFRERLKAEQKK